MMQRLLAETLSGSADGDSRCRGGPVFPPTTPEGRHASEIPAHFLIPSAGEKLLGLAQLGRDSTRCGRSGVFVTRSPKTEQGSNRSPL